MRPTSFSLVGAILLSVPATLAQSTTVRSTYTNIQGNVNCQSTFGATAFVGLFDQGGGVAPYCSCFDPANSASVPASAYTVCPGGAQASCTTVNTKYDDDSVVESDTCTTCTDADSCNSFLSNSAVYSCDEGEILFQNDDNGSQSCGCETPEVIATQAGVFTDCVDDGIPHSTGPICASVTVIFGGYISTTTTAHCSITCQTGYQVTPDGSACVLMSTPLPRSKRSEKGRNFVF